MQHWLNIFLVQYSKKRFFIIVVSRDVSIATIRYCAAVHRIVANDRIINHSDGGASGEFYSSDANGVPSFGFSCVCVWICLCVCAELVAEEVFE